MNLRRVALKGGFHIARVLLRYVDVVDARRFMYFYTKLLRLCGVKFSGTPRYISTKAKFDDFNKIQLGDRLVVSENVIFLTHDYSLTTALISIGEMPSFDKAFIRPIVVGDNVFIGMNSVLLPGSKIGNNVIVGAGSVVRGVVEDDSIIAGNPAVKIAVLSEHAKKWIARMDGAELRIDGA